jgi:molybdopterin synthase catalytic subunit
MPDIKKLLEAATKLGVYDNLGELYSSMYTESLLAEATNFEFLKSSKDGFEELKKNMEIWKKEYGIDEKTPLKDVLKKL